MKLSGGKKLEAALAKMAKNLSKPGTLRVGFLENATYPDGTNVAMVAALNDFGTSRTPPRPFFRNMIAAKKGEWPGGIALQLKRNDYDALKALRAVGEAIKGQLVQSIRDTNSPPLAESTIRRKGFSKPLIDTSNMIDSADYEVR